MQDFTPQKHAAILVTFLLMMTFLNKTGLSQNVGIGTPAPRQLMHISAASDSNLLLVENRQSLAAGTVTSIYLRNGGYYTGALKTIGTGNQFAKM